MKKLLIIPLLVLVGATSVNASAARKQLNSYCFRQAANLYGDMLDCGMNQSTAMNWAIKRYDNCVGAMSNKSTGLSQSNTLEKL